MRLYRIGNVAGILLAHATSFRKPAGALIHPRFIDPPTAAAEARPNVDVALVREIVERRRSKDNTAFYAEAAREVNEPTLVVEVQLGVTNDLCHLVELCLSNQVAI